MTKNQQDAEDAKRLGEIVEEAAEHARKEEYAASHAEYVADMNFRVKKRKDRLTNLFTNSCKYEELGWGLQELVDYVISLENIAAYSRPEIPLKSNDD